MEHIDNDLHIVDGSSSSTVAAAAAAAIRPLYLRMFYISFNGVGYIAVTNICVYTYVHIYIRYIYNAETWLCSFIYMNS